MCNPSNSQHIASKGAPNRGKMEIEHIKGDGTRSPAPHERAANAINEMLVAKYRKSDGTNDYASTYNALSVRFPGLASRWQFAKLSSSHRTSFCGTS